MQSENKLSFRSCEEGKQIAGAELHAFFKNDLFRHKMNSNTRNPGIRRHCSGKLSPAMRCRSCSGKKKSHLISAQTREIKLDMFEHEKRSQQA